MGPLDALWHLLNLFAPAFWLCFLAAGLAKSLCRKELRAASWARLGSVASLACSLALIAGLLGFGRDGKMATYAAMVLATALALWWAGFRVR